MDSTSDVGRPNVNGIDTGAGSFSLGVLVVGTTIGRKSHSDLGLSTLICVGSVDGRIDFFGVASKVNVVLAGGVTTSGIITAVGGVTAAGVNIGPKLKVGTMEATGMVPVEGVGAIAGTGTGSGVCVSSVGVGSVTVLVGEDGCVAVVGVSPVSFSSFSFIDTIGENTFFGEDCSGCDWWVLSSDDGVDFVDVRMELGKGTGSGSFVVSV